MPSPFPGVDPYLESQGYWPDFHSRFVNCCCESLADKLPDNYEARIDERVQLVNLSDETSKLIKPDVAVAQTYSPATSAAAPDEIATLEPVTVPLAVEEEVKETYIKILHRPDNKLVTVVELLSPNNKSESDRAIYLNKRQEILLNPIHLLELDFLLAGRRLPLGKDYPVGHYFGLISRADRRFNCDVYAWTLRDKLPALPVPLLPPDADVWIDLCAVFDTTYDRGRYARSIRYHVELELPLANEDKAWAAGQAKLAKA